MTIRATLIDRVTAGSAQVEVTIRPPEAAPLTTPSDVVLGFRDYRLIIDGQDLIAETRRAMRPASGDDPGDLADMAAGS